MEITKNKIIPVIFGLKRYCLSKREVSLIKNNNIYGFIIFQRNIFSTIQLKNLINHIKSLCKNNPIFMIDHEGGRINRFNHIFTQRKYSGNYFGNLYKLDKKKFFEEASNFIKFNINIFKYLGIDTVAYPVSDLKHKNTHKVIGDRAFSNNPKIVNYLSQFFINKYQQNGIKCISKHAPGHGLAEKDSHYDLPVVTKSLQYLEQNDFSCFEKLNSFFMMTAHVKYNQIDDKVATYSKKIISLIRKKIKFKGVIMTDDICMKALNQSLNYRVTQPLLAGCDIILHCNGNINEMEQIISILKK